MNRKSRNHIMNALFDATTVERKGVAYVLKEKKVSSSRHGKQPHQLWEMFPLPRLTKEASKHGFIGGSFDIATGSDLADKRSQE